VPAGSAVALLAERLLADGYAVEEGFQGAARVAALKQCVERRRARGELRAARVGAAPRTVWRPEIRGDFIGWLSEPWCEAERLLLEDLERLRLDLNREAMLGLFDLEMHYAWYPAGAGYTRHVDQPRGRAERVISLILYLNDSWLPGDGGELRLHGVAAAPLDVAPLGGRLLCFLTAEREHEVLATRVPRSSLSGWFRRRD
jgi:SM-20-related protein